MQHPIYPDIYRVRYTLHTFPLEDKVLIPFQYMMNKAVLTFDRDKINFSLLIDSVSMSANSEVIYRITVPSSDFTRKGYTDIMKLQSLLSAIESINFSESVRINAPYSYAWKITSNVVETLKFFEKYPKLF